MRFAGVLLPFAMASLSFAACSGSNGTFVAPQTLDIALPGGASALSLDASTPAARVTVSESRYNGTFHASSSATTVATVSQAPLENAARRQVQSAGAEVFIVTATGSGSAIITFADTNGNQSTVPVKVNGSGAVTLTPSTLSFSSTGAAGAATVNAAENGYSGSFSSSTTTCAGIASISPQSGTSFTVTPLAAGQCTFTIAGAFSHTATLPITVTPVGAVMLTPSALSFISTGAANAVTVNATQANYSGSFTSSTSTCAGIASISPNSGTSFTVTPLAAGHCTFTIAGSHSHSASLTIDVTSTTVGGS